MLTEEVCAAAPALSVLWLECHPGMASWVQAVGTLLALLLAIAVPVAIHVSERRASNASELRYNRNVRAAIAEVRYEIEYFMTKEQEVAGNITDERLPTLVFEVAWPLRDYISAVKQLERVLALRPIDRLEAIKAVDALNSAIEIPAQRIKQAARALRMYAATRDVLRQEYAAVAPELRRVDQVLETTVAAFPL